ncbi:MAG TPA: amidohydrolase family protein [Myxococcales bacterium]
MWIAGRPRSVRVELGRIVELGPPGGSSLVIPAVVDAHVHLAVATGAAAVLPFAGVAAVLDLGAPLDAVPFGAALPLRVVHAGPMLTAPRGYPTQSWGAGGFGLEVSTAAQARDAVARIAERQARFLKLAFDPRFALLDAGVARAAADEAHARGLVVAAHALEADSVRRALDAGCDVLAHTPREELPSGLLSRLAGKWVISTLRAFGVAPVRLRALREAGMRVAYGTDLGNEGTSPRIDASELSLLAEAGVDPLRAATADAAELLGLPDLGSLRVGSAASLLVVRDETPESIANPERVYVDGNLLHART